MKVFRLTETHDTGVSCDQGGLFVGGTQLLEQCETDGSSAQWRPRLLADINRELSQTYGLEIEASAKLGGLGSVVRALTRGDLAHAQLAALFLQIPEPPALSKSSGQPSQQEMWKLAADLHASGLLKIEWNPAEHPRWPAGTPDGLGGQFSPAGRRWNRRRPARQRPCDPRARCNAIPRRDS